MRLIDADELMEHVWRDKLDSRELIAKMIDDAPTVKEISTKIPINVFEQLISQEPKTRWIPVSERLPLLRGTYKISDDVLITNGYEIDMGYLVERKGKIFWHYYGSEFEVGIKDEDNDAIAWMPLPKPYKAESEE